MRPSSQRRPTTKMTAIAARCRPDTESTWVAPAARKPARGKSPASAKARPSKTRSAAPKKTAGKSAKQTSTLSKASHKAPSKQLKTAASSVARTPGLVEGANAPAFQLPRDGGNSISLADFAGLKLVLFFYPRADTPGCTKEAIDFTRLSGAFADSHTAVLGVSATDIGPTDDPGPSRTPASPSGIGSPVRRAANSPIRREATRRMARWLAA